MNQLAYVAGNEAGQYIAAQANEGPRINVLSCQPTTGNYGTKVVLKISSQYDLQTMTGVCPCASVCFGSHRAMGHIAKDPNTSGNTYTYTYTISAEVPQFISTNYPSPDNVPLTLIIEEDSGAEICRVNSCGVFTYHDLHHPPACPPSMSNGGSGDASPAEDLMGRSSQSPEHRDSPHQSLPVSTDTASPHAPYHALPGNSTTNSYPYPPAGTAVAAAAEAQAEPQTHTQPTFAAGGFAQETNNMLGGYRTSPYHDRHHRAPPLLRSTRTTGWGPYGGPIDTIRSPATTVPSTGHAAITRPSLTPLPRSSASTPQLIRTSTLSTPPGAGLSGGGGGYNPYAIFPTKATLKVNGDLDSMAENWNQEEWENKRRIVLFKRSQHGSQLQMSFRPVGVGERPPNSTCISCIWWAEKQECYVTSVDTIYLLEQLVAAPARFTVEEKNRIRRNLEGFHPLTVSKAKSESADFFRIIMGFGNPKPRNIEKDVKVFPWKILGQALKKIISKYSASPSATMPPPTPTQAHLLTPISVSGSYPSLPPTPGHATSATDPTTATGYIPSVHHNPSSLQSPRSLPMPPSATTSSWGPYGSGTGRSMSPGLKTHSPASSSSLRIPSLQTTYDGRASIHAITSPYGLPPSTHSGQHQQSNPYGPPAVPVTQGHARTWDSYAPTSSYSSYPSYSAHDTTYSSAPYGAQRV